MFRRFGSEVTIVHRGDQLLNREDADVANEVAQLLVEDGLKLYLILRQRAFLRRMASSG